MNAPSGSRDQTKKKDPAIWTCNFQSPRVVASSSFSCSDENINSTDRSVLSSNRYPHTSPKMPMPRRSHRALPAGSGDWPNETRPALGCKTIEKPGRVKKSKMPTDKQSPARRFPNSRRGLRTSFIVGSLQVAIGRYLSGAKSKMQP